MSIESGELKLGSSTAEQPVIMGETFLKKVDTFKSKIVKVQ